MECLFFKGLFGQGPVLLVLGLVIPLCPGAESCNGINFIISNSIGLDDQIFAYTIQIFAYTIQIFAKTIFADCLCLSIIVRILHYCIEDIENIGDIPPAPRICGCLEKWELGNGSGEWGMGSE